MINQDFTTWAILDRMNKTDHHYAKPSELVVAEWDHESALLAFNNYWNAVDNGEREIDWAIERELQINLKQAEDNLMQIRDSILNPIYQFERTILQ